MTRLSKIGRLFVIKTRLEAFLVTYAIAVGSVERGIHYMQTYPGNGGIILAIACLGLPFIAGAKLLDSVRPAEPALAKSAAPARRRAPRQLSRSRPRAGRSALGLTSPRSHHTD